MEHDPRVTRVGRILRSLSIDELPQLWNVLRGDMSLVGLARPCRARPAASASGCRRAPRCCPGVTGLWQVEARTSGSMHTYERLDLFYIENWSVGLDVMVIIATLEEELVKLVRHLLPSQRRGPRPADPKGQRPAVSVPPASVTKHGARMALAPRSRPSFRQFMALLNTDHADLRSNRAENGLALTEIAVRERRYCL